MNECQFNVSINGKHLFRTDWYDDTLGICATIANELIKAFPRRAGYRIDQNSRTKTMQLVELAN